MSGRLENSLLGVSSWETWGSSEESLGLSVLGSSEKEGVGSSWSGHNQLIEGKAFSSGFDDSCSGSLGESKGGNGHLWNIKKSIVISDGGNGNHDFVLSFQKLRNFGDRNWWSIHSGRDESSQDGFAES